MIAELQLDLFHDLTTEDLSHHAIRRRLFAEIAGLSEELDQNEDEEA